MPESKFYNEGEAEEILRLAASDGSAFGAMTRDRLVATAAEGISEDAVARAELQLADRQLAVEREKEERAQLAEYRAYHRRKTFSGLGSWVSTSVLLVGIDLLTSRSVTWSVWPVGIWGLVEIGQVLQALLTPAGPGDNFERWKRRQRRRAERAAE